MSNDNDNQVFKDVADRVNIVDYITAKTSGKETKSGATTFINPSPCCSHNDCFNVKPLKGTWKCYSCGEPDGMQAGGVFHFATKILGMSMHDALKDVAEFVGYTLPTKAKPLAAPKQQSTAEYIADKCFKDPKIAVDWLVEARGIDHEVAHRAVLSRSVGFNDYRSRTIAEGEKMHGGPACAFIVKTLNPGKVVAVDMRYIDPALNGGLKTQCQGEKFGYGWTSDIKRLHAAETVYIVESPINALSVESAKLPGRTAAFALRGTGNVPTIDYSFLRGKQVIIVPDNDEPTDDPKSSKNGYCAGLSAAWDLHERLTAMDVSALLVDMEEWGVNDINDILKEQGAEELRRVLWKLEQWAIPGQHGDKQGLFSRKGKPRIYLPWHHESVYWRFRVRPDFTSYVEKVEEPKDEESVPKLTFSEVAGFRIASISRVEIQSATATMTGDDDYQPRTMFSVSVQTSRHGAKLIRKVVDDEKLHNTDVWKKFGPVWNQSRLLRLVNVLENAAHIGARRAANFVGLCWRDGELVVNEGPDTYFQHPEQQCPYHNLTFPAGSQADARQVIEAFMATFGKSAAGILLTWALGGHLKAFLGFWPHMMLQAKKGMGKSTLIKRLERAIGFTMFSGQSLQTEFRLLTSVSHTSHPVGWEELSARGQNIIDKAVAILQENYQYTVNRRGSDMLEFMLSAPVLLAGEDVPIKGLTGKITRCALREKGPLIPIDLPTFPVRAWLSYLTKLNRQSVTDLYEDCLNQCQRAARSTGGDEGASRMVHNYAALMTAWALLADFAGMDAQAHLLNDLRAEMNAHIEQTSGDRHPWVWIMETIVGELSRGGMSGLYKIDTFSNAAHEEEECLFIRTSDIMHHLSTSVSLRDFWNGLPVKSDRVFKEQLKDAGVILGEAEKTIGNRRYSRMAAISLSKLEEFGVFVHRQEPQV